MLTPKKLKIAISVIAVGILLGFISVYTGIFVKSEVERLVPPQMQESSQLTGQAVPDYAFTFADNQLSRVPACDLGAPLVNVPAERDFHFMYRKNSVSFNHFLSQIKPNDGLFRFINFGTYANRGVFRVNPIQYFESAFTIDLNQGGFCCSALDTNQQFAEHEVLIVYNQRDTLVCDNPTDAQMHDPVTLNINRTGWHLLWIGDLTEFDLPNGTEILSVWTPNQTASTAPVFVWDYAEVDPMPGFQNDIYWIYVDTPTFDSGMPGVPGDDQGAQDAGVEGEGGTITVNYTNLSIGNVSAVCFNAVIGQNITVGDISAVCTVAELNEIGIDGGADPDAAVDVEGVAVVKIGAIEATCDASSKFEISFDRFEAGQTFTITFDERNGVTSDLGGAEFNQPVIIEGDDSLEVNIEFIDEMVNPGNVNKHIELLITDFKVFGVDDIALPVEQTTLIVAGNVDRPDQRVLNLPGDIPFSWTFINPVDTEADRCLGLPDPGQAVQGAVENMITVTLEPNKVFEWCNVDNIGLDGVTHRYHTFSIENAYNVDKDLVFEGDFSGGFDDGTKFSIKDEYGGLVTESYPIKANTTVDFIVESKKPSVDIGENLIYTFFADIRDFVKSEVARDDVRYVLDQENVTSYSLIVENSDGCEQNVGEGNVSDEVPADRIGVFLKEDIASDCVQDHDYNPVTYSFPAFEVHNNSDFDIPITFSEQDFDKILADIPYPDNLNPLEMEYNLIERYTDQLIRSNEVHTVLSKSVVYFDMVGPEPYKNGFEHSFFRIEETDGGFRGLFTYSAFELEENDILEDAPDVFFSKQEEGVPDSIEIYEILGVDCP